MIVHEKKCISRSLCFVKNVIFPQGNIFFFVTNLQVSHQQIGDIYFNRITLHL